MQAGAIGAGRAALGPLLMDQFAAIALVELAAGIANRGPAFGSVKEIADCDARRTGRRYGRHGSLLRCRWGSPRRIASATASTGPAPLYVAFAASEVAAHFE